jgi:hypothetical protein
MKTALRIYEAANGYIAEFLPNAYDAPNPGDEYVFPDLSSLLDWIVNLGTLGMLREAEREEQE